MPIASLKDPVLQRVEYLLKQEGFDIGEQRSKDVPPELLEEVFELNMMLEIGAGSADELEEAREKFLGMRTEVDRKSLRCQPEVRRERRTDDPGRDPGVLNRRRYIQNLLRDVEKAPA